MNNYKINRISQFAGSITLLFVLTLFAQAQNSAFSEEKIYLNSNLSSANNAGNNMSLEEKLIREAYRKLSVYEVVDRFSRAERERRPAGRPLAQRALKFKLKNFQIGRIEEVQNLKFNDLVTLPAGDIIDITPINTSINNEEGKFSVKANWKKAKYSSGFDSQWTLGNLLQLEAGRYQDVGKYALYEVTVFYEERIKTYRAMVLFHNPPQSSQSLKPEFLDFIVGEGNIITKIFNETKLPLGTKKRDILNQNFQASTEGFKSSKKFSRNQNNEKLLAEPCGGSWDPSCGGCLEWYSTPIDPTYTYCMVWDPYTGGGGGGGGGGEYCNISIFYASQGQDIDRSSTEHNSGNHEAHTLFDHTCSQNQNCQTNCKVVDTIAQITDDGELFSLTVHSTAKDVKINERSGGKDQRVECETAVAYGVKSCWAFLGCNASASVGISGTGPNAQVTFTPNDNLYSRAYIYGGACRNGR